MQALNSLTLRVSPLDSLRAPNNAANIRVTAAKRVFFVSAMGKKLHFHVNRGIPNRVSSRLRASTGAQMTLRIGNVQKWREKGLQPNMKEVTFAQDLVESLLNAEDKLVVVDFFSPGCGGCKSFNPKICQRTKMNPDV
ncbi:thioredoxin-like 1-1, chloroplastic [Vigna angularis]|uniref:thioredoxin-like 1-1, chloroplastic n=1 Tax=Phaseolus angularis TaxID=3914 RepID=UPI00080A0DA4|nr:thioredoxin-like 1-1, chloroplastic [Vigna angularis]